MSLTPSKCKALIINRSKELEIEAIGFAVAQPVDDVENAQYLSWINKNFHGEMHYLEKYHDVRHDPRLLLPSARTIISCAINYFPGVKQQPNAPQIASYALGKDYHEVVRERLSTLADFIKELCGGDTRVCVDTAPLRERYWAVKSGIGFIGRNNQLIIPDKGSYFFLGEILSSEIFPADEPCRLSCIGCNACIKKCPTRAIEIAGSIDARRCLSYLTIEYRGDLPEDLPLGNRIYGCDTCQIACPHNMRAIPTPISEFTPSKDVLALDKNAMESMTQEQFSKIFRHSAIKRTKYTGFMRNLHAIKE